MDYNKKYLKYKSKYIKYKNQLGGTTEEGNLFMLHGTNLFYIKCIKLNGLTGKYDEKLYQIIQKYWPIIRPLSKDPYVGYFLNRQKEVSRVSLSFTGQIAVAREYSEGNKKFGEGPSCFLRVFSDYINKNKSSITKEMFNDYNYINDAFKYPGIVLAINISSFEEYDEIKNLQIEDLNHWELTLNFIIPPDKLYIRTENNENIIKYILLNSKEGDEYLEIQYEKNQERIKLLEQQILLEERERISLEEQKNISLDEWITTYQKSPTLFYIQRENKNSSMYIKAQYDINEEETYPHYLYISINNFNNISISILIRNILNTENYETIMDSSKGFDLFIKTDKLLDNFKFVIVEIMKIIPPGRNKKIYQNMIEYLKKLYSLDDLNFLLQIEKTIL